MPDEVLFDPELLHAASARTSRLAADVMLDVHGDVDPQTPFDVIGHAFAGRISEEGIGLEAMLDEVERDILPHTMRPANPMYFGLINSSSLPGAVLGDFLVSAFDANSGAFHHTRAITPIEDELVRWFSQLVFGHDAATGQLVPSGSYANLQGLLVARTYGRKRGPDPVLYVSDAVHFSVTRAASAAGIDAWIQPIPYDETGAMRAEALAQQVEADRAAGRNPAVVFATAGTTATGAIDPLPAIATICEANGLWLHVDACYGGGALLVADPLLAGIEQADSVAVDPHKWFYMPLAAGMLLTRHLDIELETFDPAGASYIPKDGPLGRYRLGLSASRRASALAIWCGLRAHGVAMLRAAVQRNIDLTRYLEDRLRAAGFRVLDGGQLSIACARWEPDGVEDLDVLQTQLAAAAVSTGKTWFSTTHHVGETWMRFNTVNLYARERHMDALVALLVDVRS